MAGKVVITAQSVATESDANLGANSAKSLERTLSPEVLDNRQKLRAVTDTFPLDAVQLKDAQ